MAVMPIKNDMLARIAARANEYGLDPFEMQAIADIETGGTFDPASRNPNSSASGLFQFVDKTWGEYGQGKDVFNVDANIDAAMRLAQHNRIALQNTLGRKLNPGEGYLAHQQGATGAARLLQNPNARAIDIVGADEIKLNGGHPDMTAGEFAELWIGKARNRYANYAEMGGSPVAPSAPPADSTGRRTDTMLSNYDGVGPMIPPPFDADTGEPVGYHTPPKPPVGTLELGPGVLRGEMDAPVGPIEPSGLSYGRMSGTPPQGRPPVNADTMDAPTAEAPHQRNFRERVHDYSVTHSDALLALGQGLLSGNNWAEGFANAAGNMRDDNRFNREIEYREGALTARGENRRSMFPMGMSRGDDGQKYLTRWNEQTGEYEVRKPDGWEATSEADLANRSYSEGSVAIKPVLQLKTRLDELGGGLRALDRALLRAGDFDGGISTIANNLSAAFRTLMEQGLTEEEFNQKILSAEMQGLLGRVKEQVVGGGVMTEPDAMRIVMALGGAGVGLSAFTSPEVLRDRLRTFREEQLRLYGTARAEMENFMRLHPESVTPYDFYEPEVFDQGSEDELDALMSEFG